MARWQPGPQKSHDGLLGTLPRGSMTHACEEKLSGLIDTFSLRSQHCVRKKPFFFFEGHNHCYTIPVAKHGGSSIMMWACLSATGDKTPLRLVMIRLGAEDNV